MSRKKCLFPWCGLDGKLCVDCHEVEAERVELIKHLENLDADIANETDYQLRSDLQRAHDATYERLRELEDSM